VLVGSLSSEVTALFGQKGQEVDVLLLACGSKEKAGEGEENLKKGEKHLKIEGEDVRRRKEEVKNDQLGVTKELSSVASSGKI